MAKHEPWFVPRPDEDADDKLLDWLGGGAKPPPAKTKGSGCPMVAAPVIAAGIGLVVFVTNLLNTQRERGTTT